MGVRDMVEQTMDGSGRIRVAAIDLGTVSSRLSLAEIEAGAPVDARKHTLITDLGEGVDATGRFCDEAVGRVVSACRTFVEEARAFGATCICTTLTSAARDADNAQVLLGQLSGLGLVPQVIPGEVEARLTFYGVARDFPGERIAVADSGGGSTEIAVGALSSGGEVGLERVQSLNIGCRRVTDRFFHGNPPSCADVQEAARWSADQFAAYWAGLDDRPERLVAVGGTVTTLVAITHELERYDPAFVHLHELSVAEIEGCIDRMKPLTVAQIAQLKGIQPKRAHVMLAGAVVMRELMRAGGYDVLTVSENSLLAGMAATIGETLVKGKTAIGWVPELSYLAH